MHTFHDTCRISFKGGKGLVQTTHTIKQGVFNRRSTNFSSRHNQSSFWQAVCMCKCLHISCFPLRISVATTWVLGRDMSPGTTFFSLYTPLFGLVSQKTRLGMLHWAVWSSVLGLLTMSESLMILICCECNWIMPATTQHRKSQCRDVSVK